MTQMENSDIGFFLIAEGAPDERTRIANLFPCLDELGAIRRDAVITAWMTVWKGSDYQDLKDVPFSDKYRGYSLVNHINDVCAIGSLLLKQSNARWAVELGNEDLLCCFLLHDIDKVLRIPIEPDTAPGRSSSAGDVTHHGVIGAMIAHELGFSKRVVSVISSHASNSPVRGVSMEALLMHYADFFAADYAIQSQWGQPFYASQ